MKSFFCLFTVVVLMAARPATTSSTTTIGERGYYYAIVFNNNPAQAQFSSAFFANCDDTVLFQRINRYAENNGFGQYRLVGPYSQNDVEQARRYAKQQWSSSGYTVFGDNNYVGDCY